MAVNIVQTSNIRNLGGKAVSDGVRLGDTALSKVGFYGATPVVQPTTTAGNLTSLEAALVTLGLIVTS
jgi:hypothetical protein